MYLWKAPVPALSEMWPADLPRMRAEVLRPARLATKAVA